MPTLRPRFQVTETPEVERALRLAEKLWPGTPRPELVNRLFGSAAEQIDGELEAARQARIRAIDFTAGAFSAAYEPNYLDELRREWPE